MTISESSWQQTAEYSESLAERVITLFLFVFIAQVTLSLAFIRLYNYTSSAALRSTSANKSFFE